MSIYQMGKSAVLALVVAGLAACASKQTETATSGSSNAGTDSTVTQPIQQGPSAEELARLADIEARKARVVYFDFDDANIKPEYRDLLAAHGAFLAKNPGLTVTVEGHTDERGTPEYNVGLGERRANAVKQVLQSYGVQASQIKTVSFGEEKPANPGHDEAAWAQNRRGVLAYQG
ncbi:peptidoglycan-associated lipoprotein Pal [Permianibacter sp. IMCC34836]|uniref:peptidoglycan-associated lipoprotein Pal n=1 Tax=Permianibacter fluminis TaxID=2738515 RepID=UPI0015545784|nr:peptidoglycan-associated lipoprotein Pal [Permianibacter fluminis]NQD38613.1 peptidoglycan-associated lipoprotein Pal [Permianibacter fluminis]NQD38622.1 peptidoglycan-associated lipoprotein Pal [Permianibacter fluminis]